MTDNDIIKALECCVIQCAACTKCPLYNTKDRHGECYSNLKREAFNLINRQKAEIERLQKQLDDKCDRCIERDRVKAGRKIFAEIEKLMLDGKIGNIYSAKVINPDKYTELKNKYTKENTK